MNKVLIIQSRRTCDRLVCVFETEEIAFEYACLEKNQIYAVKCKNGTKKNTN